MAESKANDRIVEIQNPIVNRAFWMISGGVPLEMAVASLLNDGRLQSASDDELIGWIEEADADWRGRSEDCIRKPASINMYAPLMTACCKKRYDAIRELREASPEKDKPAFNARMARLITVRAHCELAAAEALLLNEEFQQAWGAFEKAEWAARGLPDDGKLRLLEVIWARYGQWAVASMARNQQAIDSARAGISQLLDGAGPEAQESLARVEALFEVHLRVFRERERLRQEVREGRLKPPEAGSSEPTSQLELISSLAEQVESGAISLEDAKGKARSAIASLQIQPGEVYIASRLYESLIPSQPTRAVLLAELNAELALQFPNQPGIQSTCLGVLGFALSRLAQRTGSGFERAIEVFGRAYDIASSHPDTAHTAQTANLCVELAIASRGLRNTAEFTKWARIAVSECELHPENPLPLANAYGLRGETFEIAGALDKALDDHFRALALFRSNSSLDVRRALHHILDVCLRANRLSEAGSAGREIVEFAESLGDIDDVQETSIRMAEALARVGQVADAVPLLQVADRLTLDALKKNANDRKLLEYRFETRMWEGRLQIAHFNWLSPGAERSTVARKAHDAIEAARQIALDLKDDSLLAQAWLELALLYETIGNWPMAEASCRTADSIPGCPPSLLAYSFLLNGRIAADQSHWQESRDLLDYGLKTLGEDGWDDIRVRFLNIRGAVNEQLGNNAGAIADYEESVARTSSFRAAIAEESRIGIFDLAGDALDRLFALYANPGNTRRALYWAEYSKSRGLAELLGQTTFALPAPSPETTHLFEEEQTLLTDLHSARAGSMVEAAQISLERTHSTQEKGKRLNQIWDQLSAAYPEYVELRRGAVPTWEEILELTA